MQGRGPGWKNTALNKRLSHISFLVSLVFCDSSGKLLPPKVLSSYYRATGSLSLEEQQTVSSVVHLV